MNTESQWSKQEACFACALLRCGLLFITIPVSHLANEFDVGRPLHGQVSLAAVNQVCVIHEAMNGCKNLKIHLRITSKMQIEENDHEMVIFL